MTELNQKTLKILVVDDEPTILALYRGTLCPEKDKNRNSSEMDALANGLFGDKAADKTSSSVFSFDLTTCMQGDGAVNAVKTSIRDGQPFAVVFLDVRMPPGPDGIWAAEHIRAIDPHIEIVIVTAYSDIDSKEIARRVPPDHKLLYIQKPFHPMEINQFASALSSKWLMECELDVYHQGLENQVEKRTVELRETNTRLELEIAEHKKVEEEAQKLASVVRHSRELINLATLDGKMIFINEAGGKMLGINPDEIEGTAIIDVIPDQLLDKVQNELMPSLMEHGIWEGDLQYLNIITGELTDVHAMTFTIRDRSTGKPLYLANISLDITERKRAETKIKQARDDAEKANRAKSEFLANMSHEIRTPMNGIIGMVQILQDTMLDSEQHEALGVIRKSSDSLLELINDILDISKIEACKLEMENIPFNLRITVEDVVETIAMRASEKDLETVSLIESDVPVFLKGDPGRLRQILINLMGNAIKFTKKGEITVRVGMEQVERETALLRFDVADTGVGIPHDRIQAIFDSFSQADGSTTRKYGGTGLGLTISKQLVTMMGGEIAAESQVEKGSTFTFTARFIVDAEAGILDSETEKDIDMQDLRVLVIDDNETNRQVCHLMLEPLGCQTMAVNNGFEGIEALRQAAEKEKPFSLALIDQVMPGMNGETTAREIKSDPLIKDTTIILQTSLGNRGDVKRLKEIGVRGYLVKPIRQEQFRKAVVSALQPEAEGLKESENMITRHSIAEANLEGSIVLLVEDQQINQKVATKLLQKQGLRVTIAENGQKAVEAFSSSDFDLILMDIQMPVMDGLVATEKIREKEQGSGEHIPIIAMTANAMKGNREKCLASGMDDFIPKPIIERDLFETLKQWVKIERGDRVGVEGAQIQMDNVTAKGNVLEEDPSEGSFDLSTVLAKFENDEAFFHELADIFLTDIPEGIANLKLSLENNNAEEIANEAHKLKGTTGNFGVVRLSELFAELQELGEKNSLKEASKTLSKATTVYRQVESALKRSLEVTSG